MASTSGFSEAERAAMKQRADELKASKGVKGAAKKARELEACIDAIGGLDGLDRVIAERLYVIVGEEAPSLDPKTWYGFTAYAKDDKIVVFYQQASKFNTRYGHIGFQEDAHLDDGPMWPTTFAIVEWTDEVEQEIRALVRKAVS